MRSDGSDACPPRRTTIIRLLFAISFAFWVAFPSSLLSADFSTLRHQKNFTNNQLSILEMNFTLYNESCRSYEINSNIIARCFYNFSDMAWISFVSVNGYYSGFVITTLAQHYKGKDIAKQSVILFSVSMWYNHRPLSYDYAIDHTFALWDRFVDEDVVFQSVDTWAYGIFWAEPCNILNLAGLLAPSGLKIEEVIDEATALCE